MGAGVSLGRRRRTALARDQDFAASAVAKWWDGRDRDWVLEAWDIMQPLGDGKWWAYAALWELMSNFECTARNVAKIIAAELNVDEGSRVLKRRADGSFRAHNMEVFLVPESAEEQWKGLSDELAAVRALWRCRCYYFVPPLLYLLDCCGLRMVFRAIEPSGARVIYGAGAARLSKSSEDALRQQVDRLQRILNLKPHSAFPTIHVPATARPDDSAMRLEEEEGGVGGIGLTNTSRLPNNAGLLGILLGRDQLFETIFGHQVVLFTTAKGARFMQLGRKRQGVSPGVFPKETGPDMERIKAEVAAAKRQRDEEKKEIAAQQLEEAKARDADKAADDDNKPLLRRLKDGVKVMFSSSETDYDNMSLHDLQYRCRDLNLKWEHKSRFDMIAAIRSEEQLRKDKKMEADNLNWKRAQMRRRQEELQEKKRLKQEGQVLSTKVGFALVGLRRPLRPEFVRQYEHALNADASCAWESVIGTHKGDRAAVERATQVYFKSTIPALAVELDQRFGEGDSQFAHLRGAEGALTCETLRRLCRERGIRARDLGKLYVATNQVPNRRVILTEMVFRLFKTLLRAVMLEALRTCRGLSQQPVCDAVCQFLLLSFGANEESERFWDTVQSKLEHRFPQFQNLTQAQMADLEEWETVAAVVQDSDFQIELDGYARKQRNPEYKLTKLEKERQQLVQDKILKASVREQQLRATIDDAFVHVEVQCHKLEALRRLIIACGIRFSHGMLPESVLHECKKGRLAPTDVKKIGIVSHTIQVSEFAGAIQTVMRANQEKESRRLKDLRIALNTLDTLLALNPDDWFLCAFYADTQLLLSDADAVATRYERLEAAYTHYCKSMRLNTQNVSAIYDAGTVLYRMLAIRFDEQLEKAYMEQCIQYKLEQSSPDLWNSHLRTWAALTWSFAKASKGPKMQLRATVAGRLLSLWIDYQREHHADRYHDLHLDKLDGLAPSDVFAVLEAGKQYLDIDAILLKTSEECGSKKDSYSIRAAMGALFALRPEQAKKPKMQIGDGVLDVSRLPWISDEATIQLIELIGNVQTFRCRKTQSMSGAPLQVLSELCVNTLSTLDLEETVNVTADSIEMLVAHCQCLVDFSIRWVELLMTNTLVTKIAPNWVNLTSLDISQNRRIGDEGIRAIARYCENLLSLDLSGLSGITDGGLIHVPRHCLKVRTLKLAGCRNITSRSIVEFGYRTHALWSSRTNTWRTPAGQKIEPLAERLQNYKDARLASCLENPHDDEKEDMTLMHGEEAGILHKRWNGLGPPPWDRDLCDPLSVWIDLEGAVKLQAILEGVDEDTASVQLAYAMFDELDHAKPWMVDGLGCVPYKIRLERARRWYLNKVDTEVIDIDVHVPIKTLDAVFGMFGSHPPGKPTTGVEKTMSIEDVLKALYFLNICPSYMSAQNMALLFQTVLSRKKEIEANIDEGTIGDAIAGIGQAKRLDSVDFNDLMKKIAKQLKISEDNLTRITRKWLHKPPVSMQSLCERLHPKGEHATIRSREVTRRSNDDLKLHLSIGALKIAKGTMEVLSQKGFQFTSIQIKVTTSWGDDYFSKHLTNFTRELHQKQMKESIFKQEVWLFVAHEDFLITIPRRELVSKEDWKSASLVISLEFFYYDYVRAARFGTAAGYQSQRVASLTLLMPENVETDGPVEWLACAQFLGQPDKLQGERNSAVTQSPKMPPQFRMRYRAVREAEIKRAKAANSAFQRYQTQVSVGEKAWAMLQSFMPGRLTSKIETLAEDIIDQVEESVVLEAMADAIGDMFSGLDDMDCLDLSSCDIDEDCMNEMLLCFDHLRTLRLSDCRRVRPSMLLPWVDRLTHLTDLDLSLTHDEAAGETFHEIIMNCPHLATVNFAKCRGWTDGAILHLSKRTPHLSSMNLRGCENFTDMGFTFLSKHTALMSLKISGCIQLSERSFAMTIPGLTNLTKLDASNLNFFSDDNVIQLLTPCSEIQSLNLYNNMLLTSRALEAIADLGHRLQNLNLGGNANYGDKSLGNLVIKAEALVKLKLSGCVGLTNALLAFIAKFGASLECVDLSGCAFTTAGLREFHAQVPGLKIISDDAVFAADIQVGEMDMKHLNSRQMEYLNRLDARLNPTEDEGEEEEEEVEQEIGIEIGVHYKVVGLLNSPEYNGITAKVTGEGLGGRWKVELICDGELHGKILSLRTDNLASMDTPPPLKRADASKALTAQGLIQERTGAP